MGGLLQRAIGGALQGAGDGMVDDAKAAREAAIAALAEQNKRTDQQAEFTHQDTDIGIQETGANQRNTDNNNTSITTTGMNNATSTANNAASNATSITTTGMNNAQQGRDTASNNATSRANNNDTVSATLKVATIRAQAVDAKTAAIASQYGSGKVLTYNQALTTARQAYKDNAAAFTDDSGNAIPPDQAIAGIAAKLMNNQPASSGPSTFVSTGSGMTSGNPGISPMASPSMPNGGAAPNFAMPGASSLSTTGPTQSLVAPANAPTPSAIAALKANPKLSVQFDQKYGQGASAGVMGQ